MANVCLDSLSFSYLGFNFILAKKNFAAFELYIGRESLVNDFYFRGKEVKKGKRKP